MTTGGHNGGQTDGRELAESGDAVHTGGFIQLLRHRGQGRDVNDGAVSKGLPDLGENIGWPVPLRASHKIDGFHTECVDDAGAGIEHQIQHAAHRHQRDEMGQGALLLPAKICAIWQIRIIWPL